MRQNSAIFLLNLSGSNNSASLCKEVSLHPTKNHFVPSDYFLPFWRCRLFCLCRWRSGPIPPDWASRLSHRDYYTRSQYCCDCDSCVDKNVKYNDQDESCLIFIFLWPKERHIDRGRHIKKLFETAPKCTGNSGNVLV